MQILIMHLVGGVLLHFEKWKLFFKNTTVLVFQFVYHGCSQVIHLNLYAGLLCYYISVFRRRFSISSFDRDSSSCKCQNIQIRNCKYIKETLGSLHFSMKCFIISCVFKIWWGRFPWVSRTYSLFLTFCAVSQINNIFCCACAITVCMCVCVCVCVCVFVCLCACL